ncbi:PGLS [Branchiostoma lanceolatum]|uniref:6-phosphogluconolactonase n=1 Tax=Branchiostoma lanceolatum TaxID=7740 RepID=A0A8K0A6U6_BRALA|nr:PGLS [Branchiostoma lanceolatum]
MAEEGVHVLAGQAEIGAELGALIAAKAKEAISSRGVFTIAVSGGSTTKIFCQDMVKRADVGWEKWRVFMADERLVPLDQEDCNYKGYKDALVGSVPLAAEHIYPINPSLSVEAAAEDYTQKLKQVFSEDTPVFDVVLLGMGPDGHTASLFPGHKLLQEKTLLVAPISDSPKPPPNRVTLTFKVLNNARCAVFVCTGEGKAANVKNVLEGNEENLLPAALVQPLDGELHWYLDSTAASQLSSQ